MTKSAISITAIAVALIAAACGSSGGNTTTITQGANSQRTTTSDAAHALGDYLTQVNAARQTIQATVKDIHGVNLGNSPDQSWVTAGKRLEQDASDLTDEADKMAFDPASSRNRRCTRRLPERDAVDLDWHLIARQRPRAQGRRIRAWRYQHPQVKRQPSLSGHWQVADNGDQPRIEARRQAATLGIQGRTPTVRLPRAELSTPPTRSSPAGATAPAPSAALEFCARGESFTVGSPGFQPPYRPPDALLAGHAVRHLAFGPAVDGQRVSLAPDRRGFVTVS
jgi:hypothetical protein